MSYEQVFYLLVGALVISLGLAELSTGPWTVAAIFVIAGAKAWLVIGHFMHLKDEPRYVDVIVLAMVLLLAIIFVGFFLDIAGLWAKP